MAAPNCTPAPSVVRTLALALALDASVLLDPRAILVRKRESMYASSTAGSSAWALSRAARLLPGATAVGAALDGVRLPLRFSLREGRVRATLPGQNFGVSSTSSVAGVSILTGVQPCTIPESCTYCFYKTIQKQKQNKITVKYEEKLLVLHNHLRQNPLTLDPGSSPVANAPLRLRPVEFRSDATCS